MVSSNFSALKGKKQHKENYSSRFKMYSTYILTQYSKVGSERLLGSSMDVQV